MNQPLETQSSKIVGHLGGGIRTAEQRFDDGSQVVVAEAAR
jgi:hypothetical protein